MFHDSSKLKGISDLENVLEYQLLKFHTVVSGLICPQGGNTQGLWEWGCGCVFST